MVQSDSSTAGIQPESAMGIKLEEKSVEISPEQDEVLDLSIPTKKVCVEDGDSPIDLSKCSSDGSKSSDCSCNCKKHEHKADNNSIVRPVPHNPLLDPAVASLSSLCRLPLPFVCYPAWPLGLAGIPTSSMGLSALSALPGGLAALQAHAAINPVLSSNLAALPGLSSLGGLPPPPRLFPRPPTCTEQTATATSTRSIATKSVDLKLPLSASTKENPKATQILRNKRAPRSNSESDDAESYRKRTIEQRREANARERHRVQLLLQAFDELRSCLPTLNPDQEHAALAARPSKMWILRAATAYIGALGALLERDTNVPESVHRFNESSDWLSTLLRQSGRVTAGNLSERPSALCLSPDS